MPLPQCSTNLGGWTWRPLLALSLALAASWSIGGSVSLADDGLGVRKLDPATGGTVPIVGEKPRRGIIYSHFDEQLNQRVWAHYLGDGRFGVALGPNSTQPAKLFDLRLEPKAAMDLLRRWDPKLAEDVSRDSTEIFLKLAPDQRWRVWRTTVATIYDAQTGNRFEQQFGHYIPVGHVRGYVFRPNGEVYAPVPGPELGISYR